MKPLVITQDYPTTDFSSLIIERFLRDEGSIWQQIKSAYQLNTFIRQMLIQSTIALACYGSALGISHSILQALSSAIKLPVLFMLTLAICLPTLYLFNLLCGGHLSAQQALALALAAITVTSNLTLAFAPITLFFLITAPSYPFFVLLNVAILMLTGSIGLNFLITGMHTMNKLPVPSEVPGADLASQPRSVNMTLLAVWVMLYSFVGTQLGWTLRPFFGYSDQPFQLFHTIESNFYAGVVELLMQLVW